jgi:hypothetical protein
MRLHSAKFQKTAIFTAATIKTWNLTTIH